MKAGSPVRTRRQRGAGGNQAQGKISYMLTPVYEEDFVLSPELEERLEEGRRQYREGNVTTCTTQEELNKFLDAL